jgi:hypothetical protein
MRPKCAGHTDVVTEVDPSLCEEMLGLPSTSDKREPEGVE